MSNDNNRMFDPAKDIVEPKSVTMYPIEWAIVGAFAKDMGYDSYSAALRRIVNEWAEMKKGQLALNLK